MGKKYEVVISGLAGRFPESDNCEKLLQNLLEKKDLITNDDRRWQKVPPFEDIPTHTGKIKERDTMDMTFFGLHRRLCEVTDPNQRIGLELAFSAVVDAGINPQDLWGTNTAVITNSVTSETEYECLMDVNNIGLSLLGHSRSMQANRISYGMNLTGPSLMVDSSWNGGAEGLAYAANLIERGTINAAIVASSSVIYTAEVAYHYYRMGRLTPDGRTRCFSDDADGYNRSEGSVAFFLQRKDDALRSYGSPITTKVSFQGSKEIAFSEMSKEDIRRYLKNFYTTAKIDPGLISYVEAAGVASKVVDAAELNALGEVMVSRRKKPLLVGCIKSNLGHTEAASSSVSIAKAAIISDTGIIPPNINYNKPNSLVPYLSSGEIQVVTEATPLEGDYVAVNSLSATSGFAHCVIKRHNKEKKRKPEKNVLPPDGIPRLILISGRNEDGLTEILKQIEEKPIDEEYVALVNNVFKRSIKKHLYRGFTVLHDKEKSCSETKAFFTGGQERQPVWWVFTGMGSQWPGMGVELMKLPVFAKAIKKCHEILKPKGIDLINIITTKDAKIFDNILHSFVGIAAIQIGLVDILREVGLEPNGIVGHSVGELGCAYADGCFTAEQMILASYARGKASIEVELIKGMMAAVGQGYNEIKDDLPDGIEVACHNSSDSCTLSGPTELMEEYVAKLKSQGLFAKLVNASNIAYHSRYIKPAAPALLKYLKEVIPEPKLRSPKWISSSVPEAEWSRESAKYSSAEYHTNNLLGSVLFEEATVHIPKKAVIVEIAPHGLLQAIFKRSFPDAINIPLTSRADPNGLTFLSTALGRLYLEGHSLEIEKLYPPVEFPVSRGTPSLNDLVIWDHSEQWRIKISSSAPHEFVAQEKPKYDPSAIKPRYIAISPELDEFKYLSEHIIYDQTTIPLSFYLANIIQDYQAYQQSSTNTLKIQNIKMKKDVKLTKEPINLYLTLGKGTGYWEVCDGLDIVAFGEICDMVFGLKETGMPSIGKELSGEAVYSYLKHMGHDLGPRFRLIKSVTISDTEVSAIIEWNGELVFFLDTILKVPALLSIGQNEIKLINSLQNITIDFSKFDPSIKKEVLVNYNSVTGLLLADGVEALYPTSASPNISDSPESPILCEDLHFVPYEAPNITNINELLELSINIIFNNIHDLGSPNIQLSVFEIREELDLHDSLHDVLKWKNDIKMIINIASTDDSVGGYLSDPISEYCFILTGSSELENSIKVLNSARGGFMLIKGPKAPTSLAAIFSVDIEDEHYSLCFAQRPLKENPTYILMSSEDWKTQLKMALINSNGRIVYLVGQVTSLSVIYCTTQECSKFVNSHLLRFVYIDSDLSEFDVMNCKDQLEKDLKVNILQDGTWGLCLSQKIDLDLEPTVAKNAVFKFSDIRCNGGVFPNAVSLNLTDLSNTRGKLEVFEYSGICCSEKVCGIAKLDAMSRTLSPDPIFQWKTPEGWTDEQVCTVLIPYAMAFSILRYDDQRELFITRKPNCKQTNVLIHQGLLPISQACINIALKYGREVYTSYKTQEEKEKIMKLFPEIPEENLVNSETQQYDILLLKKTGGNGIHFLVNTLSELESLKTSVRLMGVGGILFQVSQSIIEEGQKMGMMVFLGQVSVQGIGPSVLLNLHDDIKRFIHKLIEEGFASGLIKPISFLAAPPGTTNIDAVSTIRDTHNSGKKIVVRLNEKSTSNDKIHYSADTNGASVILGDDNGFWVDLIEWLMKRGTNTIYVVTTNNMLAGMPAEKLRRLQLLNPFLNVIFCPESRVRNLEGIEIFIGGIKRVTKLDAVFIIGEYFEYIMESMAEFLKDEKLVVLSEKSRNLCENRINNGLPTLTVSLSSHLITSHILIPRLDKLMGMNRQRITITELVINHEIGIDAERTAFIQHLPASVNEILDFARCPKEAQWREVKSCSPMSNVCFELPPVFVIPPLKKGQLNHILQNLFHPTFVAVAPEYFEDFEDLAEQLYQGLQKFDTGVYTIICSDWSWIIGLLIGKLLEAAGKIVSLIFFECPITWDCPAAFNQVQTLVNKELSLCTLNDIQKKKLDSRIQTAFRTLKHRLGLFSQKLPEVKQKIKGICHYLRPDVALKTERISKIEEHCERPLNVHTADDFDFLQMLGDRKLINLINTFILFEYKDAANKIEKVLLKDAIFQNPRLSYLNFLQTLHDKKIHAHLSPQVEQPIL